MPETTPLAASTSSGSKEPLIYENVRVVVPAGGKRVVVNAEKTIRHHGRCKPQGRTIVDDNAICVAPGAAERIRGGDREGKHAGRGRRSRKDPARLQGQARRQRSESGQSCRARCLPKLSRHAGCKPPPRAPGAVSRSNCDGRTRNRDGGRQRVAQLSAATACTWKLKTPGTSGVPETTPLVARTSPGGKEPAIKENVTGGCPPTAVNALA